MVEKEVLKHFDTPEFSQGQIGAISSRGVVANQHEMGLNGSDAPATQPSRFTAVEAAADPHLIVPIRMDDPNVDNFKKGEPNRRSLDKVRRSREQPSPA